MYFFVIVTLFHYHLHQFSLCLVTLIITLKIIQFIFNILCHAFDYQIKIV